MPRSPACRARSRARGGTRGGRGRASGGRSSPAARRRRRRGAARCPGGRSRAPRPRARVVASGPASATESGAGSGTEPSNVRVGACAVRGRSVGNVSRQHGRIEPRRAVSIPRPDDGSGQCVKRIEAFAHRYGGSALQGADGAASMQTGLVERARKGDTVAFGELVDAGGDLCFAIAYRILRDAERAEDAVQQAYLLAWRDLPTLRDPDRFDAWLHRLLVNACYAEIR